MISCVKLFTNIPCYVVLSFLLSLSTISANSQVTVYPMQDFNFGTFYQGNTGGTVDISTNGTRSATGDVVLMNIGFSHSQAIFEIEAPQSSIVTISKGPDVILYGSNGGSITLKLGNTDPEFPHIIATPRTQVKLGGTLIIGDKTSSPPGNYTGSFSITFHQE